MHIVAEGGSQEFFITREFEAPRELVFQAFSQAEYLEQFLAPTGRSTKYDYCNYQNDGSYRYSTSDTKGKVLCTFRGVVHEVTFPERIIQTAEMEGLPVKGHVVLDKMTFEALPGGRTRLVIHDICMSVSDRDMILNSGMQDGLKEIFIKLDHLLQKLKNATNQ